MSTPAPTPPRRKRSDTVKLGAVAGVGLTVAAAYAAWPAPSCRPALVYDSVESCRRDGAFSDAQCGEAFARSPLDPARREALMLAADGDRPPRVRRVGQVGGDGVRTDQWCDRRSYGSSSGGSHYGAWSGGSSTSSASSASTVQRGGFGATGQAVAFSGGGS